MSVSAFRKTPEPTRRIQRLEEASTEFPGFLQDALKYAGSSNAETLGDEATSVFVAWSGDDRQVTAYCSFISFASASYGLGLAYSVFTRTRLNVPLGMSRRQTAKHLFEFLFGLRLLSG